MHPVLTRRQMQALDRHTIEGLGLPGPVLMEVAGRAVADAVERILGSATGRVVALVGPGNNGGDAVVAARHLTQRGHPVELVLFGPPEGRSADLLHQLSIAFKLGLASNELQTPGELGAWLSGAAVAIDGLFGIGLSRPIAEPYGTAIRLLNESGVPVVAVDVPSGIDVDTGQILGVAVQAEHTVTFQHPKPGLLLYPGRAHAGDVEVVDIGLPPRLLADLGPLAEHLDDAVIQTALPPRPQDSHKGTYGHLLVVAGVPDRPGSALLASRAALRVGTGLVTVASDPITIGRIAGQLEALMGHSLADLGPGPILEALAGKTGLALGPSLLPTPELRDTILAVLQKTRAPVVLDAGALSAFAGAASALADHHGPLVLTPHPGEAGRLLGLDSAAVQADRPAAAQALAQLTRAVVILKGAGTLIARPDGPLAYCTAGSPGMATGGTGDVLTGALGGLLAQGVEPVLAAWAAVQLHARAGERAAARVGEAGLIASDLHLALAEVLAQR